MPTLRRLHVATTGLKQPMAGKPQMLTHQDIAELAQSYDPALHSCKVAVDDVQTAIQLGAPACLGHIDPALVQAKGAMPAFGRVVGAEAAASGLYLDVELTDKMADWIAEGLYDHVSVSWYDANDSRNPTPGRKHLRHLGWLGAEPSAMKDLALPDYADIEYSEGHYEDGSGVYQYGELTTNIEFAEPMTKDKSMTALADVTSAAAEDGEATAKQPKEMAEGDEQVEATAEAGGDQELAAPAEESTVDPVLMLVSILQDGDKGYKGEVSGFEPEPTADNQYLWNEEAQEFAGKFMDDSGNEQEVYTFSLALQPDGSMIRSYRKVQEGDAEGSTTTDPATVEAEADAADTETAAEFGEGCGTGKRPEYMEAMDKLKQAPEMGECDAQLAAAFVPGVSGPETVTLSMEQYQMLQAKAADYESMRYEVARAERAAKQMEIEAALKPMYDAGLIDQAVACSSVANAILSMGEAATESYELEFSEGVTHTSPMETVLAVLGQIGANAKIQHDTDIEFGEMSLPSIDSAESGDKLEGPVMPAGTTSNKSQAALDAKAREYCTKMGWDCKDTKSYIKAVKAVASGAS